MQLFPIHLYDNVVLTTIILIYVLLNILAWSHDGIFVREITLLKDLRNERTFNLGDARHSKIKPFLTIQYYLFFGLTLFTVIIPEPSVAFSGLFSFSLKVYLEALACILVPLFWFGMQYFFYHWLCMIFGGDSRMVILDRVYSSVHLLVGQLTMILFTMVVVMEIPAIVTAFLLTGIFIITQIVFIYSGFKIFYNGFSSVCLYFVYLCALEIAPLVVILVKMTSFWR